MPPGPDSRAEALIDLAAFRANLGRLRDAAGSAALMVVVKADAYGHGAVECAGEARRVGVPWLGVALPAEALLLRAAGDQGRILTWLYGPGQDFEPLVRADVDVSVSSVQALDAVAAAAHRMCRPARVHLKADTGLGRGGATIDRWSALAQAAHRAESEGLLRVVGVWSHLSCADDVTCSCTELQIEAFGAAIRTAEHSGLTPELRHLANSAATLLTPGTHFDLVRPASPPMACRPPRRSPTLGRSDCVR